MKLSEQLNNEGIAQDRKYPFFINSYLKKEITRIYEEKYVDRAFKLGDKIPENHIVPLECLYTGLLLLLLDMPFYFLTNRNNHFH